MPHKKDPSKDPEFQDLLARGKNLENSKASEYKATSMFITISVISVLHQAMLLSNLRFDSVSILLFFNSNFRNMF
jgi:hypothetical protein